MSSRSFEGHFPGHAQRCVFAERIRYSLLILLTLTPAIERHWLSKAAPCAACFPPGCWTGFMCWAVPIAGFSQWRRYQGSALLIPACRVSCWVARLSRLLVSLIVLAELFSWHAVLTTNYAGAVAEESLWAVAGMLLVVSVIMLWGRADERLRTTFSVLIILGVSYTAFMVLVDIPMYYARLQADLASGASYLSPLQGVIDAARRCTVTSAWKTWREEVSWMTLYFSTAVWLSIALTHTPRFRSRGRRGGFQIQG